jgi:hypothetical protein
MEIWKKRLEMQMELPKGKILWMLAIFLLSFILTVLTPIINNNTLPTQSLNDNERYYNSIVNYENQMSGLYLLLPLTALGKDGFFLAMSFVFYFCIGVFFFGYTKDKTITLLALLCFSTSLVTTFALYAQGLILLIAVVYWQKVEFSWKESKLKEIGLWLGFALFTMAVHRYGILIWLCVFAAKLIPLKVPRIAVGAAYALVCGLLLFGGVNSTTRLTFYYPTLLPIDLGTLNTILWLVFLSLPLFATFILTEKSEKTKRLALFTYLGTFAFYLFITHLEIDIWRMMIFVDFVMLLEIARARAEKFEDPEDKNQLLDYVPIVLLLFGLARLILGMRFF